MIDVISISKQYGKQFAVRDISFSIQEGEIVGLLGPNGAGKSTTMNIITGYLSPTAGKVVIDGYDAEEEPEKARRKIGYLPELAPLYQEMTVREFLTFSCSLQGMRQGKKERIAQVADMVGISDVLDRPIANLSKGYRQRVGMGHALIGDPKVLILDEPTVGLDPNQIIQMRDLIRQLGQKCTIILSSHILSEIQAVCDRIIIIQNGRIVADGKTEDLTNLLLKQNRATLSVLGPKETIEQILSSIPEIRQYQMVGDNSEGELRYSILQEIGKEKIMHTELFHKLAAADCPIMELYSDTVSLEELFHELTWKPGRNADDQE